MDETLALPTEFSAQIALRTQQIIALETGAANTVDPLGGSYFVESLTDSIEGEAEDYIRRIDAMGGMVAAIEAGFPQKEIQDAAYRYQRALEKGEKFMVGVNAFADDDKTPPVEILQIDAAGARQQTERVQRLRETRDAGRHAAALAALQRAAAGTENLMPHILEAVRAYATLGEIVETLKAEFGVYEEPIFI
jgi:methylmalonyl-CoA mutase N-terminal domain/subunit